MNQATQLTILDPDDLAHVSGGNLMLRLLELNPGVMMMRSMIGGGLRYDHLQAAPLFGNVTHVTNKYYVGR